jgi:hypothetical protein
MKSKPRPTLDPEKQLRILAREFRGTSDDRERDEIAQKYADAVTDLIKSGTWNRIPPLEDQLPDERMPDRFFQHWSLQPPDRTARQTG